MKVSILDNAGNRVTDLSAVMLLLLLFLPSLWDLLPPGILAKITQDTKDWIATAMIVIGWVAKFIRFDWGPTDKKEGEAS